MPKYTWTEQEKNWVKEHYLKPNAIEILTKLIPNKTPHSIRGKWRDMGLRKVIFAVHNEKFFEHPNIQNCQVAGLLASDGFLEIPEKWGSKTVGIHLNSEEYNYLVKLKEIVNWTGNIHQSEEMRKIINPKTKKEYNVLVKSSSINITRAEKWHNNLYKYWNITPRKTYTLIPPNLTDLLLKMAFISGLIDGDGHIVLIAEPHHRIKECLKMSVSGTEAICTWVKECFDFLTPNDTKRKVCHADENCWTYSVSGVRAYVIGRMFLCLNLFRMSRKWDNIMVFGNRLEIEEISKNMVRRIQRIIDHNQVNFLSNYGQRFPDHFTQHLTNNVVIPIISE